MPLKKADMHKCIFCPAKLIRTNLKRHLTSAGKKGPRCPDLKKVVQLFKKLKIRIDRVTRHGVGNYGDEARKFFDLTIEAWSLPS